MKNPVHYIFTSLFSDRFVAGLKRRIREAYYRINPKAILNISSELRNYLIQIDTRAQIQSAIDLPGANIIDNLCLAKEYLETINKEADEILDGYVDLLGSGKVRQDPLNWHIDFKTGFEWPKGKFFRNYNQEEIGVKCDVKVPRELSRSHHLLRLSLCYYITRNERYSKYCIYQINNWIDENPLMYSINWCCTMDVAIRAVNWIWTLRFLIDSPHLTDEFLKKIMKSLYEHGWHIFRNPEKEPFNNHNHYLSDLAGQIILGEFFRDLKEPQEWLRKGKEELFREIRMQILPSGMSYERSTNYNRLVLELILIPTLTLQRKGHEIPSDIWHRLEKMFEFLMYSIKPDGNSPIVGDQDNGRLLPLGTEAINNFKYLLSLGGLLFDRSDFKHNGEGFNIYCSVLGAKGAFDRWGKISEFSSDLESKAFSDSGFYVMREKNNYLLFNAAGKSLYPELGSGTHTHSDLFSFELFTHEKSFLIDPGSFVYSSDSDLRMFFRSTKMHNTVTVDGESQNNLRKEEMWDFSRDAIPRILRWESNSSFDIVSAVHNGYTRLREPVLHERTIIFDKINEKWTIKDTITGNGYHIVEWFFHFDADIDFDIMGNVVNTTCKDDKNIILTFEQKPGLCLTKERSFISKSYGIKEDGYVLVALIKEEVPVELTIEITKLN
jgi:hypothetical protein